MAASEPLAEALSVLPGQIESGIASPVTSQCGSVAFLTPITETDDHDGDDKGPETELSDEEESTTITQELETKITRRETRMLSTFPTGELIPPNKFRFTTRRARLRFYLTHPEQSRTGWIIHHVILLVLIVNIAVMTAETLDGPRFPGSAPVYNYIPGDRFFHAAENFFTAIYVVEFVLRRMATRNRKMFWRVVHTWLDLLALTPELIYYAIRTFSDETPADGGFSLRFKVGYLRLFRIVRIVVFVQVHDGSKVMTQAIRQSIAPLKVTLFFLITIVMVYATAIFYAEPCYDLYTCTFTDIFNAGYFVMVTVATIGYGSQLPSFSNPVSVVLTGLVMIFGSLYLSMPLAIVGINYETAWQKYEESQHRAQHPRINAVLDTHSPTAPQTASVPTNQYEGDETLNALESCSVHPRSHQLCDRFYLMGQNLHEAQTIADKVLHVVGSASPDTAIHRSKVRMEMVKKVLEDATGSLRSHKRIVADIRRLIGVQLDKSANAPGSSRSRISQSYIDGSFSRSPLFRGNVFSRARRALGSVSLRSQRFQHADTTTWQSRVWEILQHNDISPRAFVINRCRLVVVLLSIALFYAQTTPEFQNTGVESTLCQRTIYDFCTTSSRGYFDQPGCFVLNAHGQSSTTRIRFDCLAASTDPTCYGNGYNFGSDLFSSTCADVFGSKGVLQVCHNRLCQPPITLWMDMEPIWMYIEFGFGFLFTVETILRIVSHPQRSKIWKDSELLGDFIALFPFYVELGELAAGITPIYSIIPTAPSFFSVIRVLKSFRILRLGAHIAGSEVLMRTAVLVYKRLMIPIFFLAIGSTICGAIFYEIERGTECFVGKPCMWWGKNVLTSQLAEDLPDGKRILVQNTQLTTITDMMKASWLALETITTVGYGDLFPRTMLGRFFGILTMIMSACYTAMPLTLVGRQFYACYDLHLQDQARIKLIEEQRKTKLPSGSIAQVHPTPSEIALAKAQIREAPQVEASTGSKEATTSDAQATSPVVPVRRRSSNSRLERPSHRALSAKDMELLNQFARMSGILSSIIDDLSQLTRAGSPRQSMKQDLTVSDKDLADVQLGKRSIEQRIKEDLAFCVTFLLRFGQVIDKLLDISRLQGQASNRQLQNDQGESVPRKH